MAGRKLARLVEWGAIRRDRTALIGPIWGEWRKRGLGRNSSCRATRRQPGVGVNLTRGGSLPRPRPKEFHGPCAYIVHTKCMPAYRQRQVCLYSCYPRPKRFKPHQPPTTAPCTNRKDSCSAFRSGMRSRCLIRYLTAAPADEKTRNTGCPLGLILYLCGQAMSRRLVLP
ncbi:hypothetical protein LX36DRAFT_102879 [Colletotrichum falcatum]|nr:hypothetical protein LX36DRAFT_102879 [Colletotrichum falcatum]